MGAAFDVLVMGSGAAGLTAALAAARRGARVLVAEKSLLVGGSTAISGGQVWIPNNPRQAPGSDTPEAALRYLQSVTLGEVERELLDAFVAESPRMLAEVEAATPLRFARVERVDYHPDWPGAGFGRSLEPLPLALGEPAAPVRRSPYRAPLTSAETKTGAHAALVAARRRGGIVAQGVALVGGLLQGCLDAGVTLRTDTPVTGFQHAEQGSLDVQLGGSEIVDVRALVVASGGFEWNEALKHAFLGCVDEGAATPPSNEGDGLRLGLVAGAAVGQMTQSWWSAAYRVPGEVYDGRPLVRNIVRELALPGSILVNADGHRFANEAASYNALGKAFQVFDAQRNAYVNRHAWLVFDQDFKDRYPVATVPAGDPAPDWFLKGASLSDLAVRAGIAATGLEATVARFNDMVRHGADRDFHRGATDHDRYHGDPARPHPNLAPLRAAPFHAVPIFLGNLGTKGGLKTRVDGQVLDLQGHAIAALYACGNAAASWMGPGYPGAGGSLGPIMTAAWLCGTAAAARSSEG